jgi:hypothetical protein
MVIIVEWWYQIPWYFNLRKSMHWSILPWYFYNIGQKTRYINPRKRRHWSKLPWYFYNIGPRKSML